MNKMKDKPSFLSKRCFLTKIKLTFLVLSSLLKRYRDKFKAPASFLASSTAKPGPAKWTQLTAIFFVLGIIIMIYFKGSLFQASPHLSEGMIGLYTQNNLPVVVTNLISSSLVVLDESGHPQPGLVSGWQVEDKATTYIFKMKSDLTWSDGTKIKSSDIKFNIPDVEVSYPDEQTIRFKLADSFNLFPTLLTSPVFKNNSLVGIGQYKVSQAQFNHSILISLTLTTGSKNLPDISFRFYPDEKTAKTAFEIGEVDSLMNISETSDLLNHPGTQVRAMKNFNKLVAIFYNTKDPVLSDKNMRKALNSAAPIIEGEERAKTSVPKLSWAYNNNVKDSSGDIDLSKSYLKKVSFGKESNIVLTTTPGLALLGEKVISSWKKAGISAVLRVESGIPQNFQALLISEPIPSDPDQYLLWHSTQSKTNLSKYASPRVDKDLEDGRKMEDLETRKDKYWDFQKVLAEDIPATFLYFPKIQVVYRKKVEDRLNQVLGLQLSQLIL